MIQHLLILVVMAPLLVAGAPLLPLWLGLPRWARRLVRASSLLKAGSPLHRLGHWLRQPAVSCGLLIIGMWAWHWPALYDLALTNAAIHDWCEHLTFLAVSVLFWTQVIPSPPLRPRLGYLGRMVCLGIAIAQNVVLAVLLGFAHRLCMLLMLTWLLRQAVSLRCKISNLGLVSCGQQVTSLSLALSASLYCCGLPRSQTIQKSPSIANYT